MCDTLDTREISDRHALDLSENALTVLRERYLARDDNGQVTETPAELFRRVARAAAAIEDQWGTSAEEKQRLEGTFYQEMASGRFLPNSPTLMNAGRQLGMLSACFVLPLGDSIPEIMETARQIALVQRAGGGIGIDLSDLRPRGSIVRSSGGTTDGPLSFLKMFSGVTEAIQQGAFRRGANMGIMRIDHPDILAFVDLKSDLSQVTNYNLSVAVSDMFMETLYADPDSPHIIHNPHTDVGGRLVRETSTAVYEDLAGDGQFYTVRDVWQRIVRRAWETGDPGLIFIDEINRHNPTPHLGAITATNPCGEQPLLPHEACNLGSINLAAFFLPESLDIDLHGLQETVATAVRFLDNVVEANRYPTPEIHEASHATRKIGLGVMGFADLLFEMRIPYDSDEAIELAERIGATIRREGWKVSKRLAEERGCFPAWDGSVWETESHGQPMRNAQVTIIAPTGTISILADCSSGIEPVFSLAFERHVLDGKRLRQVNRVFDRALRSQLDDERVIERILVHAASHGTIQECPDVPEDIHTIFRTARDISPEWHVRMQAAWQNNTDAAVSETINLSANASVDDVEQAYLLAHELKCKGITVYRDGARPLQPMALAKEPSSEMAESNQIVPMKLPQVIPSVRLRQPTPFGNMHLHISVEPQSGAEREVFAQLGKGGDLANSDLEAICRLISLLLRSGGDLHTVIDQLEGIGSSLSVPAPGGRVRSLADGLARALQKFLVAKQHHGVEGLLSGRVTSLESMEESGSEATAKGEESLFKIKCPECDSSGTLAFEEGCLKCHGCGYSIC
jgi:ribonucleoside-diphosphate reductase alpha chain